MWLYVTLAPSKVETHLAGHNPNKIVKISNIKKYNKTPIQNTRFRRNHQWLFYKLKHDVGIEIRTDKNVTDTFQIFTFSILSFRGSAATSVIPDWRENHGGETYSVTFVITTVLFNINSNTDDDDNKQ